MFCEQNQNQLHRVYSQWTNINIADFVSIFFFSSCAKHLSFHKSPSGGKCFQFYGIIEFTLDERNAIVFCLSLCVSVSVFRLVSTYV